MSKELVNVVVETEPSRIEGKFDLHLKGENHAIREIMPTTGYFQVMRTEPRSKWYLLEFDGKAVFLSEFRIKKSGATIWETLVYLPYADVRDPQTGMVWTGREIIRKYGYDS